MVQGGAAHSSMLQLAVCSSQQKPPLPMAGAVEPTEEHLWRGCVEKADMVSAHEPDADKVARPGVDPLEVIYLSYYCFITSSSYHFIISKS